MLFARPPKPNFAACDVGELVCNVVEQLHELAGECQVELVCEPPDGAIQLPADATQLGVAIRALVVNSLEAIGRGGHVRVGVRQTSVDDVRWIEIAVRDDGPGISDEVRRHMFDPFFSGREAGRGLGFGLSKCWRIVSDHGGQVVVQRPAGGGAEIAILLPLVPHTAMQS
jgi:signal transduction histidine kinase